MLRALLPDLRVIVPCRAKSNGTMLALVGTEILMGPCSELVPADPFIQIAPNNMVPATFLVNVQGVDPIISQVADHAIKQTRQLATTLLESGMMKGKDAQAVKDVVEALTSRQQYHSHGSVIDAAEACRLGLQVHKFGVDDDLWQRLWLLRCMYEHDAASAGALKIFEGPLVSNSLRAAAVNP
jgi:ClpP class serine protease